VGISPFVIGFLLSAIPVSRFNPLKLHVVPFVPPSLPFAFWSLPPGSLPHDALVSYYYYSVCVVGVRDVPGLQQIRRLPPYVELSKRAVRFIDLVKMIGGD
jgi:hypothetical protein